MDLVIGDNRAYLIVSEIVAFIGDVKLHVNV